LCTAGLLMLLGNLPQGDGTISALRLCREDDGR
jgi:hypothetical protein